MSIEASGAVEEQNPETADSATARIGTAALAAAVLAACGGGSSGSSTGSTGSSGGSPPGGTGNPGGSPAISALDAARFAQQASLSVSDADIAAIQSAGYSAWLDQQFAKTSSQSRYDWLMANGYNVAANQNNAVGLDNALWHHLIAEPNGVVQRVALFWSEFFVVSVLGLPVSWRQFLAAAYMDLLEAKALGNFRDLLQAVTLSPAMGEYLNLRGSQKADAATNRHPDENYAREVMQLFTIGLNQLNADGTPKLAGGQPIATYTQNDVTGLAAAFTGWEFATVLSSPDYAQMPMVAIETRHQITANTFLGVTIPANTSAKASLPIILDTLFNHPNVAPFVARQMIQRLVTSNPSAAYVGRVAAAFANDGAGVRGNLKAVVKAVLLDAEARQPPAAATGRVREPMLRLVQWARTFKATSTGGKFTIGDTSDAATRLGQSPLRSPSVFNFFDPAYTPPGSPIATRALVAPEMQIVNESTVAGYLNYMQRVIATGAGDVVADYSTEVALAADPAALTDRINLLMAAGQLSQTTVAAIRTAVAAIPATTATGPANRVGLAIFLAMASPEYQVLI